MDVKIPETNPIANDMLKVGSIPNFSLIDKHSAEKTRKTHVDGLLLLLLRHTDNTRSRPNICFLNSF